MKLAVLLSISLLALADPAAAAPTGCTDPATGDPQLDDALAALTIKVGDGNRSLAAIRIAGLTTLEEAALWKVLGDQPPQADGQPPQVDGQRAALVLRRLLATGLFAKVTPVLELPAAGGAVLVLEVVEHPTVRKVVFEGLSELKPDRLLQAMLKLPPAPRRSGRHSHRGDKVAVDIGAEGIDYDVDESDEAGDEVSVSVGPVKLHAKEGRRSSSGGPACGDPVVPTDWLARVENDGLAPGIAWRGLAGGLERVLGKMFDLGYQMAALDAALAADGTLTVRVREGRLARLEIRGVEPRIQPRVLALLDLPVGGVFVAGELERGLRRLDQTFPFLMQRREERPTRARPGVVVAPAEGGEQRYRTEERPDERHSTWFTVKDDTVVLHLRARPANTTLNGIELVRHTPVTGFAPGLERGVRVWDPADRVHFALDLAANLNTHRADSGTGGERWRFDWLVGPHLEVPDLRIAEAGVQLYSRVDTSDRWRINRLDSYIYSLLLRDPGSDYFHRKGLTAFLTTHFANHFVAGVEYRRDRYESLFTVPRRFALLDRIDLPDEVSERVSITDGTMASLLVRLEISTLGKPSRSGRGWSGLDPIHDTYRDPERSIVRRRRGDVAWAEFHTLNTLELADPGLGGDAAFRFVRLVSDSSSFFRFGRDHGVKLRFRAAGRLSGDELPVQKQEALGGWSALRGYGWKELAAGNFSLLGTGEYRMSVFSAFVDVGSVRTASGFASPLTGLGLAFNFTDETHVAFAWRTDDRARARPEIRFLFHRNY